MPAAYEQGVAKDLAQTREHGADGRLCEREPFRRACNALLLEQGIERHEEVEVDESDISHNSAGALYDHFTRAVVRGPDR